MPGLPFVALIEFPQVSLDETQIERLRAALDLDTFVGRFTVAEQIGRGGMGTIYRATERATERPIAIKVLRERDPVLVTRFAAEAELLERLDHPGIVAYVAHGVTGAGEPYLAMAWLDGESLAQRLDRGALSVGEAIAVGRRLAAALTHAHAHGIVHRDLKPGNVMLIEGKPDSAMMIDFGIAKDTGGRHGLTHTGQILGTPGYMAPEQALGHATIDARADLFALGALLYECLTGRPPFDGHALLEVLARLLLEDPPRPSDAVPAVPPRLDALVRSLLAKRPEDRLADAAAAEAELVAIGHALETDDHAELEARTPTDRRAMTRAAATVELRAPARAALSAGSRRPMWLHPRVLVVIVGLAMLAVGLVIVMGGDDARPSAVPPDAPGRTAHACETTGLDSCRAACELGDGDACDAYGRNLYLRASHLPARQEEAIGWLMRGCELGTADACMRAGMDMHALAKLGAHSYPPARVQAALERGCTLGRAASCIVLGGYLMDQAPPDRARALVLYVQSCESGSSSGCDRALRLIEHGSGSADAERRLQVVLERSCRAGQASQCDQQLRLEQHSSVLNPGR